MTDTTSTTTTPATGAATTTMAKSFGAAVHESRSFAPSPAMNPTPAISNAAATVLGVASGMTSLRNNGSSTRVGMGISGSTATVAPSPSPQLGTKHLFANASSAQPTLQPPGGGSGATNGSNNMAGTASERGGHTLQLHPSTPNGSNDAPSPLPQKSQLEAAIQAAEANETAVHGPFKILASVRHLWALGIVTVLGGHYFSWNPGLAAGIGTFSVATGLISFAYLALVMCLAEMSSCLQVPFAGGSFFFARATMGRVPGFLVGCAEALEYVAYVATTVIVFGEMITTTFDISSNYEPLWWFLFYVSALPIHLKGGKFFWEFNWWFAIGLLVIHFFYVFATIPYMDDDNAIWDPNTTIAAAATTMNNDTTTVADTAAASGYFVGGFHQFMVVLALPTWFYIGVETLTLGCEEAHAHKTSVGRGLITCMVTLFICMLVSLYGPIFNGPDLVAVSRVIFPFNYGFQRLCKTAYNVMTIWSLPATYGTCFGFIYAYGRQVCSMARSGILPSIFARTYREHGTPYWSTISCSIIAYLLSLLGWLAFETKAFTEMLFALYQLGALLTYTAQLVAYLILWYKYRSVPRAWQNPLGPVGAILALIIFTMTLISVVGFQPYTWQPVLMLVCWFIPLMCYYWRYARHRRSASPEEICALFILHTVKINRLRVMRVKQQARAAAAAHGNGSKNTNGGHTHNGNGNTGSKLSHAAGVLNGNGGTTAHRAGHTVAAGSGFAPHTPGSPGGGGNNHDPVSKSASSVAGSHTRQFMARFNVRHAQGGVVGRPGVALVSTSPAVVASHGDYRPPASLNVSAPYISDRHHPPMDPDHHEDSDSPPSPAPQSSPLPPTFGSPSSRVEAFAALPTSPLPPMRLSSVPKLRIPTTAASAAAATTAETATPISNATTITVAPTASNNNNNSNASSVHNRNVSLPGAMRSETMGVVSVTHMGTGSTNNHANSIRTTIATANGVALLSSTHR